jgi:leucyl aminopeptidase (aminopeptidase T)
MAQPLVLDDKDLVKLIDRVFQPGPEDRSLAFLVDLPDTVEQDQPEWKTRRDRAFDWYQHLANRDDLVYKPHFYLYHNTSSQNAELPAGAWEFTSGRLPATAEELAHTPLVPFQTIFSSHPIFIAMSEFSASAPLRIAAKTHRFRAASMPGFSDAMIPALRLDLDEIHQRVEVLRQLLDGAREAQVVFRVDDSTDFSLTLDLRHRQAHSSSGLLREPGMVGNLPSGEAFIVPYEGEIDDDPSRTHGRLPVELKGEVVVFQIEHNRAVAIESSGPVSDAERQLLKHEPAVGNLAELGFGVLAELGIRPIGETLLDEKLGLHIAFGRSDHFGGHIGPHHFHSPEAVVHIDRVYVPDVQPRITVRSLILVLNREERIEAIQDGEYTDLLRDPSVSTTLPLTKAEQYEAFSALLSSCLQLTRDDELLVIYDEAFSPFMGTFLEIIKDKEILITLLNIPYDYQIALTKWSSDGQGRVRLPDGIGGCIDNSSAVLTMLNGELATNQVRRALLQQARPEGCRLAHIPGISFEVLRAIRSSPFEQIMKDCELLGWALGEAKTAELTTCDSQGESYTLTLELGGWKNEPLMSPGVLRRGSWGNVPPGETFCCPLETSVSGAVCINGSVPGYVLMPGKDMVIVFEKGKAVDWRPASGASGNTAVEFMETQKAEATKNRDRYWNTFAELGIGLNPAILRLTGNSLFDEKALGTVHIAIGDNSMFGHNTRATIHADLVIHRPTLKLDDQLIIHQGQLQHSAIQAWRKRIRGMSFGLEFDKRIVLKQAKITEQNGLLLRQLRKAGRVGYINILDEEGSRALAVVANALINMGAVFPEDVTRDQEAILGFSTQYLLGVLFHYDVLEILE